MKKTIYIGALYRRKEAYFLGQYKKKCESFSGRCYSTVKEYFHMLNVKETEYQLLKTWFICAEN